MTLDERLIQLYVTAQGFKDLGFLLGIKSERDGIECLVRKTDSVGIWIVIASEEWRRVLVVPWRYVRAISFLIEERKGKIKILPGQR